MSSSHLFRPSLKAETQAAMQKLLPEERKARETSQFRLLHSTLEQTLLILPRDNPLAQKIQLVIHGISQDLSTRLLDEDATSDQGNASAVHFADDASMTLVQMQKTESLAVHSETDNMKMQDSPTKDPMEVWHDASERPSLKRLRNQGDEDTGCAKRRK